MTLPGHPVRVICPSLPPVDVHPRPPAAIAALFAVLLVLSVLPPARAAGAATFTLPTGIARVLSADFRRLDDQRQSLEHRLGLTPTPPEFENTPQLGWRIFDYNRTLWRSPQWVEVDFGELLDFDAVALIPALLVTPDFPAPGYGFPLRFRVEAFGATPTGRILADFTQADFAPPGALPVWLPAPGGRARRVRLTVSVPWQNGPLLASALAEFMVLQGRRNLATGRPGVVVRSSDSRESPPAWSQAHLVDGQSPLGAPLGPRLPQGSAVGHCWHSQLAKDALSTKWVQIDLGRGQALDEIRLLPARLPQRLHLEGYGFPVRFRVEVSDDPAFRHPRVLADHTAAPFPNPGFNPVTVPAGVVARYVRVTATELQHRSDHQYLFALAELQAYAGDTNVARGTAVSYLDNLEASQNWRAAFLTDGARWEHPISEWPDWLHGLSNRREILGELAVIESKIVPALHALTRAATWTTAGLGMAGALLLLAGYYRQQLRRAREADALRRRIAADLHDDLGSNLASLTILSELCLQSRDAVPRADLEELHALARETADALRDTTWFVRPGAHTTEQFIERLRATARRLLPGVEWSFDAAAFHASLPIDVQRHLLLALKESLHNIARHAAARHVRIRLSFLGDCFTLEIFDDGRGFDATAVSGGQGLTSLRHRARLLGGEASFASTPGAGTTLTFTGRLSAAPVPSSLYG